MGQSIRFRHRRRFGGSTPRVRRLCPSDSTKSPERMCGAFEYYFSVYPLGELDVPIKFGAGAPRN